MWAIVYTQGMEMNQDKMVVRKKYRDPSPNGIKVGSLILEFLTKLMQLSFF